MHPAGGAPPAARGAGGGFAERATWTLTSRPPGPEPRDLAAYVVDTIAVSYHGNNTTHLDAPSHMYYKGQSTTDIRRPATPIEAPVKTIR